MAGIVAYGSYIPYNRLDRQTIGQALGVAGGRGARAVASYDEDTTSMAAEAALAALATAPDGISPSALYFSTADPAYLDKTNATAIHAALGLGHDAFAVDMVGAVRSGAGALRAGLDSAEPTLVCLSDVRTGLPGGADEAAGGDGAVAFLCAREGPVIAEFLGSSSTSAEFLDRWRLPGESTSRVWEERFGEFVYVPLAQQALQKAMQMFGVNLEHIDHLVATGVHPRALRTVLAGAGVRKEVIANDLSATVGNTGTAHFGLMLADVLDRAEPNQLITVLLIADGATAMFFRTTDAIAAYHARRTVQEQIATGRPGLSYESFLTWRNMLKREPPRRPDPDRPGSPPSFRSEAWKYGFCGSRCEACGARHLPPARVCVHCHTTDKMKLERLTDVPATIATFTIDRLAYSPSPPMVAAVLDFDGGGRFQCELTDVDPDKLAIGQRVEMTFRRLYSAEGIHNYFWKARPVRSNN